MATLRSLIVAELKAASTGLKEIAGCASRDDALAGRLEAPGCYAFPLVENYGKNTLANGVSQEVTQTIGLLVVTRNVQGEHFDDSADENEHYRQVIKDKLLGKELGGWGPLLSAGSMLYSLKNGLLVWQVAYRSSKLSRSVR
jgi:hypothetical protein